jgi:hypothetical protein
MIRNNSAACCRESQSTTVVMARVSHDRERRNHPERVIRSAPEFRSVRTSLDVEEDLMTLAMSAGTWIGAFIFLVIWIALAFWPARVAGRKGHSFVGYFILSLLFFPLALILAYVVRDRRGLDVRA